MPVTGKVYPLLLLATSLAGYLEWGGGHHAFLFEAEAEILAKLFTAPRAVLHPFVLLPLGGQLLLLVTLLQKKPWKTGIYLGIGCIGLLFGLMLGIGLMGLNLKIAASTLPFGVVAGLAVRYYRKN